MDENTLSIIIFICIFIAFSLFVLSITVDDGYAYSIKHKVSIIFALFALLSAVMGIMIPCYLSTYYQNNEIYSLTIDYSNRPSESYECWNFDLNTDIIKFVDNDGKHIINIKDANITYKKTEELHKE